MRHEQYTAELHGSDPDSKSVIIETAFRMADAFPSPFPLPSPKDVMDMLGCSRATAYRWVRAMKAARGIAS